MGTDTIWKSAVASYGIGKERVGVCRLPRQNLAFPGKILTQLRDFPFIEADCSAIFPMPLPWGDQHSRGRVPLLFYPQIFLRQTLSLPSYLFSLFSYNRGKVFPIFDFPHGKHRVFGKRAL